MTDAEDLMDELCGVSPAEVTGLLMLVMQQSNQTSSTHQGSKRVRVWNANLLGIEVKVTEVDTCCLVGRPKIGGGYYEEDFDGRDYHVESVEWEFKVRLASPSGIDGADKSAVARMFNHQVRVHRPWFEGDVEDYRRDMTMIRLLDLKEVQAA